MLTTPHAQPYSIPQQSAPVHTSRTSLRQAKLYALVRVPQMLSVCKCIRYTNTLFLEHTTLNKPYTVKTLPLLDFNPFSNQTAHHARPLSLTNIRTQTYHIEFINA
eukprot:TRINITY_DN31658_c0_g1_i1.p2 TRINITY_DN31658_c0_g1~~TRINITY_DN31658_c0_g1_i1.p2  ORF type:complete len:106 (-),score=4.07 TRINITY_DN31658_c0_g1_i1:264-581(-)